MNWHYDRESDAYWLTGLPYCERHPDMEYGTMGIFVPGAYLRGGKVCGYTADTAPIVLPIDTGGYAAMRSPEGFVEESRAFIAAGFVDVRSGCRGRSHGAPTGVTDLKAAIRFLRSREDIPGDKERIFTFGMSGGGAQSALVGATGDSPAYGPYLAAIGACEGSDAVLGSMCWCPVTTLDMADAAYEWCMGEARPLDEQIGLGARLAQAYPAYVEQLELPLERPYREEVLALISRSLNNYLEDTAPHWNGFASPEAYVAHIATLGDSENWVTWEDGKAVVRDLGGFVRAFKQPWKPVGAFDNANRPTWENELFGGRFCALMEGVDLDRRDALGTTVADRVAMYDPLHFLCRCFPQYRTAKAAPYFRIRTGVEQGDTSLTTEMNLALALRDYGVDVDFETVWAQGHVLAERTGSPMANFIRWVNECIDKEVASCGC